MRKTLVAFFSLCLTVVFTMESMMTVFAVNYIDDSQNLNQSDILDEEIIVPNEEVPSEEVSPTIFLQRETILDGGVEKENWVDENGNTVYIDLENDDDNISLHQTFPSKYSLLELEQGSIVTPVKHQGTEGLCWAFAGIGSIESNLVKSGYYQVDDSNVDFSEAHLSYFNHNGAYTIDENNPIYGDGKNNPDIFTENNQASLGGNHYGVTAIIASWSGAELEKNAPYEDRQNQYKNYIRTNSFAHIKNMDVIPNENAVKSALMDTGAVYCTYYSDNTYYKWFNNNTYYTFKNPDGVTNNNHAVLIVGWDDNFNKEYFSNQPSNNGAWLIKNSWGAEWGDDGYFWLSYEEPSLRNFCSFKAIPASYDYNNNYQYNGYSHSSITGYYSPSAYSANIFKANNDELIKGTGFYTAENNYDVEAKVYLLNDSPKSPIDGELIYSQTQNYNYSGYHTIDFKEPIYVKQNQKFSIVIVFSSKGDRTILYVEGINNDENKEIGITYTSIEGQSFISSNGENWSDTKKLKEKDGTYNDYNNVYIRAFTDTVNSSNLIYSKSDLDELIAQAENKIAEDGHPAYGVNILKNTVELAKNALDNADINNCYIKLRKAIDTIDEYVLNIDSTDKFVDFLLELSKNDFYGYNIYLETDIVFDDNNLDRFVSSGTFNGNFFGNNHTISGITKEFKGTAGSYKGIFPTIEKDGVVKDLIIDNCRFDFSTNYCGILAGRNYGLISNCIINDNSSAKSIKDSVAGIVGRNEGKIQDCISYANITGSGNYAGGISGYSGVSDISIIKCANYGDITAKTDYAGGIIGYFNNGVVDSCYNVGNIISEGNYSGGITARLISGKVQNCYNIGNITGKKAGLIAALVPKDASVINCRTLQGNNQEASIIGNSQNAVNSSIEPNTHFKYGAVAYMLNYENENGNVFGQADGQNYPAFIDETHPVVDRIFDVSLNLEKCESENILKAADGFTINIPVVYDSDAVLKVYNYSYGGNTYNLTNNENIFTFVMPAENTAINIVYYNPASNVCFYDNDILYSDDTPQKTQIVDYNMTATEPTQNPEKNGYIFKHWSLTQNGEAFDFSTPITKNTNLYAVWETIDYNININLNDGILKEEYPKIYNAESEDISILQPTKNGYTFLGWSGTDITDYTQSILIAKGSTGDRSYTANWEKTLYTISFELNGGKFDAENPSEYYYDSDDINIINPTKTGYIFLGWNGTDINDSYAPALQLSIPSGSQGNRKYTANWLQIPVGLTAKYKQTLNDVKLPDGFQWQDDLSTPTGSVGINKFKVKYIPQNANYPSFENIDVEIDVQKIAPTFTVPQNLTGISGNLLESVILPDGFEWKDKNQKLFLPQNQTQCVFKAIYTPEDTNYSIVDDVEIIVTINDRDVFLYGDVDYHYGLEINDAVCLLQKVLDSSFELNSIVPTEYADVNGDNKLTAIDVALILQKVLMSNGDFKFPVER